MPGTGAACLDSALRMRRGQVNFYFRRRVAQIENGAPSAKETCPEVVFHLRLGTRQRWRGHHAGGVASSVFTPPQARHAFSIWATRR